MAHRETIQIGNPLLKATNTKITDFKSSKLKELIKDLVDTMRENGLIGLASPQVGDNFKLFVTEPRQTEFRTADQTDDLRVYINPKMVDVSKEQSIVYEGCGSVINANLFGPVKRPKEITIEAYDEKGKKFQLKCDGALARVIQHEYDHLDGIEFTEKIDDYSELLSRDNYIKYKKNDSLQKENMVIYMKEVKSV